MDEIKIITGRQRPARLVEIPNPPKKLYLAGQLPDPKKYKYLTVVGSRKYSGYGREACERLIGTLADLPVVIVSGLAIGIDSIAHRAALKSGLPTIGVPGSGLAKKVIYPRSHVRLAEEILAAGGALLSEFEPETVATPYTFPQRNRIMAGLSEATLIIEAGERSGTLITARLALDYNREVLAVPGSIFSGGAGGTNRLIKDGATPITELDDLLKALGFESEKSESEGGRRIDAEFIVNLSPTETIIYELLKVEPLSRDRLLVESKLGVSVANTALSMMEVKGLIKEIGGEFMIV